MQFIHMMEYYLDIKRMNFIFFSLLACIHVLKYIYILHAIQINLENMMFNEIYQ
jgi:hypothetical protein